MKQTLVVVLLILWINPPVSAAGRGSPGAEVSAKVRKAERFAANSDYQRAVRSLVKSLEATNWKSFEGLRLLAKIQIQIGHPEDAIITARTLGQVAEGPEQQGEASRWLGIAMYQSRFSRILPSSRDRTGAELLGARLSIIASKSPARRDVSVGTFPLPPPSWMTRTVRPRWEPLWLSEDAMLKDAVVTLRRAVELRQGSVPLDYYHLAEALTRLNRNEEAALSLNEYFKLVGPGDSSRGPRELRCWLETDVEISESGLGAHVTPPQRLEMKPVRYTSLAKIYRLAGQVIVQGVIDEQGNVRCARSPQELPMGMKAKVLKAVEQWKYEPARLDGVPIAVRSRFVVKLTPRRESVPVFQVR